MLLKPVIPCADVKCRRKRKCLEKFTMITSVLGHSIMNNKNNWCIYIYCCWLMGPTVWGLVILMQKKRLYGLDAPYHTWLAYGRRKGVPYHTWLSYGRRKGVPYDTWYLYGRRKVPPYRIAFLYGRSESSQNISQNVDISVKCWDIAILIGAL